MRASERSQHWNTLTLTHITSTCGKLSEFVWKSKLPYRRRPFTVCSEDVGDMLFTPSYLSQHRHFVFDCNWCSVSIVSHCCYRRFHCHSPSFDIRWFGRKARLILYAVRVPCRRNVNCLRTLERNCFDVSLLSRVMTRRIDLTKFDWIKPFSALWAWMSMSTIPSQTLSFQMHTHAMGKMFNRSMVKWFMMPSWIFRCTCALNKRLIVWNFSQSQKAIFFLSRIWCENGDDSDRMDAAAYAYFGH